MENASNCETFWVPTRVQRGESHIRSPLIGCSQTEVYSVCVHTVYYVKSTQTTNQHHIYIWVLSQRHHTTDTNISKSETSGPKHFCFCVVFETSHLHSPSISVFMLLFLRQSSHYIAQAGFEPVIIIPQSHKQWEHRHIQPCSITLKRFWQRKLNLYLQFLFTSSSSPIPNFLRMPHYTFVDTSNSTRIKNKNKTVVKILTYTQITKSQESIILPTPTPTFLLNSSVIST